MNLHEKIKTIPGKLSGVIKAFPVELGLCLYLFITLIFYREDVVSDVSFLILAPLFIGVGYVLNNLFPGRFRLLYYASWLPLVPLSFFGGWTTWVETPQCIITLCVLVPLGIFLCRRQRENSGFVGDLLKYGYSGGVAVLMSGIAWALFLAIFFSVVYIFKIWEGSAVRNAFTEYSAMVAFLLLFPTLFFTLLSRALCGELKGHRLTDILLNYIITPALLIYTAILYLYFIRIVFAWELPQGGIAYLVFGFVMVAMVVQAVQSFVEQRLYNWYFNYFSWISFPALLMFWAGVMRRVSEYGLTEQRVYLLLCGLIMTVGVGLFLFDRLRSYLYLFSFAFLLFFVVAYIPGLSAENISVRSQQERVRTLGKELHVLDAAGHFVTEISSVPDSVYRDGYHRIYKSLVYLEWHRASSLQEFGISSADDFINRIPTTHQSQVLYSEEEEGERVERLRIESDGSGWKIPLKGYKEVYGFTYNDYGYDSDTLTLRQNDTVIFVITGTELLNTQLEPLGYSLNSLPSEEKLKELASRILVYRTDSFLLKMKQIRLSVQDGKAIVDDIDVDVLLKK